MKRLFSLLLLVIWACNDSELPPGIQATYEETEFKAVVLGYNGDDIRASYLPSMKGPGMDVAFYVQNPDKKVFQKGDTIAVFGFRYRTHSQWQLSLNE